MRKKEFWKRAVMALACAIILIAIMCICWREIVKRHLESEMQMSKDSIVEIFRIPSNENCLLVNVINRYTMDEKLFLVAKDKFLWSCTLLTDEVSGITDVVDVVCHQWKDETYIEIASSTSKGNGMVDIYKVENNSLKLVLTVPGAVDRNLDTTTNSVYENGRLFLTMQEAETKEKMPDMIMSGTELVYGYSVPGDYTGEEMLYQRNHIRYVYRWDICLEKYLPIEETNVTLQQMDIVYPVDWNREFLEGQWKVTELTEMLRMGVTLWSEEIYLGRSITITDDTIEESMYSWPSSLYRKADEYQYYQSREMSAERFGARTGLNNWEGWYDLHENDQVSVVSFYRDKEAMENDWPFDEYIIFPDGSVETMCVDGLYKLERFVEAKSDIELEELYGEWRVRRFVSYEEGWIGERPLLELNRSYVEAIVPELSGWEALEEIDFQVKEYYGYVLQIAPEKMVLQSGNTIEEEHSIEQYDIRICDTKNYQYVKGIHDELGIASEEIQVITGEFADEEHQALLEEDIVVIDDAKIIVKIDRGWYLLEKVS